MGKVLVCEDNDAVAWGIEVAVGDAGHEPHRERLVGQAWDILWSGEEFDILITDVDLGRGLTGLHLARAVRKTWPHMPIIVFTGNERVEPEDLPGGPTVLIRKPVDLQDLALAVGYLLDRSRVPELAA